MQELCEPVLCQFYRRINVSGKNSHNFKTTFTWTIFCTCLRITLVAYEFVGRYNCNRYDEEEAKKARDAQEVNMMCFSYSPEQAKLL